MNIKKFSEVLSEYKSKIVNLDNDSLTAIAQSGSKAMEYAERGIGSNEPEKLNDEYINTIANEMQLVAKMVLNERTSNK